MRPTAIVDDPLVVELRHRRDVARRKALDIAERGIDPDDTASVSALGFFAALDALVRCTKALDALEAMQREQVPV